MTNAENRDEAWRDRFPGFSSTGQAKHWDDATRQVVLARLEPPKPLQFLAAGLASTGIALVGQLVAVDDEFARGLLSSIDQRLLAGQLDGWHYDDMPIDLQSWPRSLHGLDEDAQQTHDATFSELGEGDQQDLLESIRTSEASGWHGMPPAKVWDLWMRYATAAYYSHPSAWDEIGFPGPAYPRGYKNPGIDSREPFEVKDTMPHMDPTATSEL